MFAVVVAGFLVWALWPNRLTEEAAPTAGGSADADQVTGLDPHTKQREPVVGEERSKVEERVELDPNRGVAQATATLKGRCVDSHSGKPLLGCKVSVKGSGANSTRMEKYLRTHEKVEWENPAEQTTTADGYFEFSFVPPPPFQFFLRLTMPGRVVASGHWSKLDPGTLKDLGDIPVGIGTLVSGIVLDTNGAPQDKVEVHLDQYDRSPQSEVHPRRSSTARTGADGRFRMRSNMASGSWNLRLRGRQLVSSDKVELAPDRTTTHLEIRVRPESDTPKITGVVVDETGAPVRGAELDYRPRRHQGRGWSNSSGKDGSFVVKKQPNDDDGPVQISVERRGYEHNKPTKPVAWGTTGLRLKLKRA